MTDIEQAFLALNEVVVQEPQERNPYDLAGIKETSSRESYSYNSPTRTDPTRTSEVL